jgi:hypothetical protein
MCAIMYKVKKILNLSEEENYSTTLSDIKNLIAVGPVDCGEILIPF